MKAVAATTLLVALLAVANQVDPVREGLNGTYYQNATRSGPPVATTIDPQLSNDRLRDAFHGAPPSQFSTTWAGSILAINSGPYALATVSDDGSAVYVDGQLVVDNRGRRDWPRGATGLVTLSRGVHAIYVEYSQEGGAFHLELLWGRPGQPLEPIPAWALAPRRVSFRAFAISAGLKQALAGAEWLWVGSLVMWALIAMWSSILRIRTWLRRERAWPALKWILGVSLILNVTALWWGLPGGSWAPDELTPSLVMGAAGRWFAHGWFDRYPPFHFYVLTALFSPLILLERFGRLDLGSPIPYAVLAGLGRIASIAAGAGTLLAIYAAGARAFGQRAGTFAVAMFALVTPFVYYAKTANLDVPYLFWFAISLVFFLRLLDELALRDFIGFAAAAMLAICTKDQAYGLYLLTPLPIVHRLWQAHRQTGERRPLRRALIDRRIWWAVTVAILLFAVVHNIFFNLSGFWQHVLLIIGPASATYRDFEPTIGGRLALLRLSVDIVRMAWGWPMFLITVAGVIVALMTRAHRRTALLLAVPIVSYYLGFIDVVLYNYDRFMLPVCLVLSLFGGLALDRWTAMPGRGRTARLLAAGAAFACTLMYASMVDIVMLRDSRYTVEQWFATHVARTDVVGFVFPQQYYPRLEGFNSAELTSIRDLEENRPLYYVLNADYALAEPTESDIGQLIAGLQNGQLGYRLVFRYREPAPWSWLPGRPRDLAGERKERPITSVLRHIDPWYEVFKRGI